uniref:Uncharacterized protein n=1 Tax=Anguilla anguilla TaxID=7936 RepID=A0A0E9SA03_ANGAN
MLLWRLFFLLLRLRL